MYGPRYIEAAPLRVIQTEVLPMPRPRPPEAEKGRTPEEPRAPATSQCLLALTSSGFVIAEGLPPIAAHDGCGADDVVRLHAVVVDKAHRVELKPAPTLRCGLAVELSKWIRQDVAAEVLPLGATLAEIENDGSYECRPRNNVPDGGTSEHGLANAIDLHSFKLTNGRRYEFTDPNVNESVRQTLKSSACARFSTVLGPGSDEYHGSHIHLDLKERRNGFRLCQWDIRLPSGPPSSSLPDSR
jgi:hypothetical protein